jgi:prolyl-tRNA editing enzyme YbaK/EbsC (Cys-tRNA(Pro) deacylase)
MVDEPVESQEAVIDATPAERASSAMAATGIPFEVTHHGHVTSLEEAAAARGLEPRRLLKSMVVRRADDDFLFVLVPGGRTISWPKLRALLGVSRLSMPSADVALAVTGYPRGTITPLGSVRDWPVIADAAMPSGPVSIGGGASGTAFTVDCADLIRALDAQVADVTDPEDPAA